MFAAKLLFEIVLKWLEWPKSALPLLKRGDNLNGEPSIIPKGICINCLYAPLSDFYFLISLDILGRSSLHYD
jgi:hypothetical protein